MALGEPAVWFTFVSRVLAAVSAVLVLVWNINFRGGLAFEAANKNLIFNLHPVLMLIGFVILGGEVIKWKEGNKVIHLTLHAIALVLGATGIHFAFKFHNESGIVNLYSLHSWLGLGTICFFGIQWVIGFVVLFFPGATSSVGVTWHVLFGLFIYVLAVATAELGFLEKLTFLENSGLYKYGPEAYLVNFLGIIVVFLGAFVVLTAISPAHPDNSYGYAPIPAHPDNRHGPAPVAAHPDIPCLREPDAALPDTSHPRPRATRDGCLPTQAICA